MKNPPGGMPKDKSGISSLLASKRVEDILMPQPIHVNLNGQEFKLRPMPDSSLMIVAGAMRECVEVLETFIVPGLELSHAEILPLIPTLAAVLIPKATPLIAASLEVDEEFVRENTNAAGRLRLLSLILETEDIPLLIKNAEALVSQVKEAREKAAETTG